MSEDKPVYGKKKIELIDMGEVDIKPMPYSGKFTYKVIVVWGYPDTLEGVLNEWGAKGYHLISVTDDYDEHERQWRYRIVMEGYGG